jgi:hypothetical protein
MGLFTAAARFCVLGTRIERLILRGVRRALAAGGGLPSARLDVGDRDEPRMVRAT